MDTKSYKPREGLASAVSASNRSRLAILPREASGLLEISPPNEMVNSSYVYFEKLNMQHFVSALRQAIECTVSPSLA